MISNTNTIVDFSIEIESLYIAHVFKNINKKRIAQLFEKLSLARIKGIDFVTKIGKDGKPYNSAYIHVDYWFDNSSAKNFQEKIRSDAKEALLVYDDPWYWIVNENISDDKSKCIKRGEQEKIEETQNESNDILIEMLMVLDNLEKLCAKNNEDFNFFKEEDKKSQEDYEAEQEEEAEREYQILKELRFQERDEAIERELQEQQNK